MEYNSIYNSYVGYVDKCRSLIKNTFFTNGDMDYINCYNNESGITDIVRKHRLKMIDIKVEHTMRMIEQCIKINENLGLKIDLGLAIKVAVLYHDIGRIRQSIWSNTFNDSIYKIKNQEFNNHSEDGYDIFLNNVFCVDSKYIPIISQVILHHQDLHSVDKLKYKYKYDGNLSNININNIVTGNFELNNAEWEVTSLIVQLVADIDKCDILYQHLSSDFEMIRDYVYDNSKDSLDDISKKWGISKNEIIEYNNLDEFYYQPKKIKIPVLNLSLEKLEVPMYMKEMFYNNSWPELNVLIQDINWNFISILWWRLSHFLNQISFTSTLANIEESNLLEQIYEKIPVKFKPLVSEAFEYALDVLVKNELQKNRGKIYLR